jgi:RNA polymerase sigma-70 factor, ECF subfamily
MDHDEWLAERFEAHRARLHSVAYRMLGSLTDAEDAVQTAWLRASGARTDEVDNLGAWLTTIVARVCLNMLRSRGRRPEQSLDTRVPDPLVSADEQVQPEAEAVLADSVSLALLVVLDVLTPAERLAFVLHDLFDVPFDAIAAMLGRNTTATRQLASRARRRVKGAPVPGPDTDLAGQRRVVNAFFTAARDGDFDGLVAVLQPDAVLRIDAGPARTAASMTVQGADAVARQTLSGMSAVLRAVQLRPVLVNGAAGVVLCVRGQSRTVIGFTVADGKIAEMDAIADTERVQRITAGIL